MSKSFKIGSGKVVYVTERSRTEDGKMFISTAPVFRGRPDEHAKLMMKANTPSGALAMIDKLGSKDPFWVEARNFIVNRQKEAAEKKAAR